MFDFLTMLAAGAAAAPVNCPMPVAPPPELAAWTGKPASLASGTMIAVGKPARATLSARARTAFIVEPAKAPPRGSYAGIFGFSIGKAGLYRIALSDAAWIDVVAKGAAVDSATHDHGPPCTGIRKIVQFDLTPGRYTLQLSGSSSAAMKLLIQPVQSR